MKLTVPEFRASMVRILQVASTLASLTPTPRDDQAVHVLSLIINNDEIMDAVAELLAKEGRVKLG